MLIKEILQKYRWRFIFTSALILSEAFLIILFPLFIGNAISGLLNKSFDSSIVLGLLGLALILIGGFRRMFDSRFYAKVYTQMGTKNIHNMHNASASVKTARLNMLSEIVAFAEHQLPEIVQHSIGLIGVLTIVAFLNFHIFLLAILAGILIVILYLLSSKRTIAYNTSFNNELEEQVNAIDNTKETPLKFHLLKLMKWNIKLSDLETINYSLSWLVMILLLISSIYISVSAGQIEYGALFALIMYVYQYIESIASLPLYYQKWLRLQEIASRIQESK